MEARGSRALIARLFAEGKRICEIAKLLNMDPSNVRRTVKRFQETSSCEASQRPTKNGSHSEEPEQDPEETQRQETLFHQKPRSCFWNII